MKERVAIYIGIDSRQAGTYDTCKMSIQDYSDIKILPIRLAEMEANGLYWRQQGQESTEFAYTRFLTPYLKGFYDYAIFCDSDFIWNSDPLEMIELIDPFNAVSVVQHNITEDQIKPIKMDGQKQHWYPRKNWSSLMVFNCKHPYVKRLTPEVVSESPPGYLHELDWAGTSIGNLPRTYNYLVGYYKDIDYPKAIHYTDGGPWHPGYENCDFADKWYGYKQRVVDLYGRY